MNIIYYVFLTIINFFEVFKEIQYISELSYMELGTGLEQDYEPNRFPSHPNPVPVPYNFVLKRTVFFNRSGIKIKVIELI